VYKLIPLTTDSVVLSDNRILLIKRLKSPFKNCWALPGGFVEYGETTEKACLRELKEETSIEGEIEKLIGVYSNPDRDPRGHTVSIAYLVTPFNEEAKPSDDAKKVKWIPINQLPKLAFDHLDIINDALQAINKKN